MKEITIKVLVYKDITACAQMRSKSKDSKYYDFICGVDLIGHVLIANCPQVWGSSFLDLTEIMLTTELDSKHPYSRKLSNEYSLEDLEYVEFCDDSSALVSIPDYEDDDTDYYAEVDRVKKEQREEVSKYLDRLVNRMETSDELEYWIGYVTIRV